MITSIKRNCWETLDFVHELGRMCSASNCTTCALAMCEFENLTEENVKKLQAWSDSHPEPPTIDPEAHKVCEALAALGFTHIAADPGMTIYAYTAKPKKDLEEKSWCCGFGDHRFLGVSSMSVLIPYASWTDEEPVSIADLLALEVR